MTTWNHLPLELKQMILKINKNAFWPEVKERLEKTKLDIELIRDLRNRRIKAFYQEWTAKKRRVNNELSNKLKTIERKYNEKPYNYSLNLSEEFKKELNKFYEEKHTALKNYSKWKQEKSRKIDADFSNEIRPLMKIRDKAKSILSKQ